MGAAEWTTEEVQALRDYYPVYGPQWDGWRELLPNREGTSLRCKAHKLGISSPRKRMPWTDAEREIIGEYFPAHGPSWCGWAVVLPERSVRAIGCEALRMGVTCDAAEVEPPLDRRGEAEAARGRPPHDRLHGAHVHGVHGGVLQTVEDAQGDGQKSP